MTGKYKKGDYGYIKAYRMGKLTVSIILAAMIAFIIITMLVLFGDTGRVMIVFAILLVLPFAKFFIAWIMCAGFSPLTKEEYDHLISVCNVSEDSSELKFDIVITRYEGMKFYQSLCVKNGRVIALVTGSDYASDKKEYREWIETCINSDKYKYPVTIYNDIQSYAKKYCSISSPNDKTALVDRHILEKIITACV